MWRRVGLLDSPLEPSDLLLELLLLERVLLARLVRGLGKLHEHLTQLAPTVSSGVVQSARTSSTSRLAASAFLVAFLAAFNSFFNSSRWTACSSCAVLTAVSTALLTA